MLNDRSPVPLYYQLQEIIRARIDGGQWPPGQQLPPEAELCDEFNLSRGTVRQALADLVREGLLHRRRGKGSFVARPKIDQDIASIASGFSSYATNVIGSELGSRLISANVVEANESLAKRLRVAEGSPVVEVRKVKLSAGQPFFLATSYVPSGAAPGLEKEDLAAGSLFGLLRDKYGFSVKSVKGWFEPVLVNEYEASVLDVERSSPAMLYQRVRVGADDRPLMASKHIIRGDMCRLTFQLNETNGKH